MNFLNKEKKDGRALSIMLGIFMFLTYCFADFTKAEGIARSMGLLMGMEMNVGMYVMFVITSAAVNYLIFLLFISLAYSLAYRSLVGRTRDIKVMPISKDCFVNHVQIVMIIVNLVIGGFGFLWVQYPVQSVVLEMLSTAVLRAIGYVIVLALLCRIGVGDNVKKKIYGGFLTPLAVLLALMI